MYEEFQVEMVNCVEHFFDIFQCVYLVYKIDFFFFSLFIEPALFLKAHWQISK